MSDTIYNGEVIWFKKGYGFISWNLNGVPQKDMFVHYSDIEMDGFKIIKPGQKVTFCLGTNNSGEPKAVKVQVNE